MWDNVCGVKPFKKFAFDCAVIVDCDSSGFC